MQRQAILTSDEENPWQTLDRRPVYENPWIRVREDRVVRPDGAPGVYGVVEFKNWAIGIVPLTAEGDTFLVGQYRYPLDLYSWEIPEGGVPEHESALAGAQRELLEETGITAETWTYLGELHTSNSVTDERGAIFLAEGLHFGASEPEGTERLEVRRLPLQEAYALAMRGDITDSLSVIGLARATAYLQSGRKLSSTRGPLAP